MRLNPDLPPKLEDIINKALEKDRNLRYQHASEIRTDLQRLKRDTETGRIAAASLGTVAVPAARFAKLWKIAAIVLLVALLVVGGLYYRSHQQSKGLTDKDTIVLADFANSMDDPIFDDTLKTALNVSLRQSPFLNVLSDSEVAKTLQQMTRPASTKLTPEVARELCLRAGSKAYIAGTVGGLGSEYVLGLKAVNCQNGDMLAQEQVTAATKEKVLDAQGEAASKLRGELGESLASVQKFDVPREQATTSSLEALQEYSLGIKAFNEKGATAAPSRPGELHPGPLTEPDVSLSTYHGSCHPSKTAAFRRDQRAPPVTSWPMTIPTRVTCSLRSPAVNPVHHYYGAVRPWSAHWYFRPHGASTCAFSLSIADQVLKFRTKARIRVTAPVHRTSHSQ